MDYSLWKTNWPEARQHFIDWWANKGLVVVVHAPQLAAPRIAGANPVPAPATVGERYGNVEWRAQNALHQLARTAFELDSLAMANSDIGPGSLALALGCKPHFTPETVWFEPCIPKDADLGSLPPIKFNPDAPWWKIHEAQLRRHAELARGNYMVSCPDLVENIDILSAMRDPQTLMVDMIENPEWVSRSVAEINRAYFEGCSRVYDIIKNPDGSSCFGAFGIWGPGKTAKVQCDACSMFSPEMFRDFVKPALSEQCAWLDNSLYHLDGTQCVCHLDHLLSIPALKGIQWTPQSGIEGGAHERWHPMYKRVLDAGKSVHIGGANCEILDKVFQSIGAKGVYIWCSAKDDGELLKIKRIVDKWRK